MFEETDNFSEDTIYMRMALREAFLASEEGEVPVGAVIVKNGEILGKAHNQTETLQDPTARRSFGDRKPQTHSEIGV